MSETAFIVKVRLEKIPPATGHGWALFVADTRIPKYWEYAGGIYSKVLDDEFLSAHQGERLRFSENGADFVDTGVRLPGPGTRRDRRPRAIRDMPLQSEVLADSAPARAARPRAVRKRARPAREGGKGSPQAETRQVQVGDGRLLVAAADSLRQSIPTVTSSARPASH